MDEVLVVIIELVGRLPLDRSSCCARAFRQGVLNRCFDVVLLHRWRRNGGEVIAFIRESGMSYGLFVVVCCGPCDV